MINIYSYHDYKQCVNDWITSQPSNGHGQLRQMANAISVNSVVMSQVFRGGRELTLEQGLALSKYIGLDASQRDYFLLLVQKDRAGNFELREIFEKQLSEIRSASQNLKSRIKHQKFSDEEKATFYSRWFYSAVRLGISIPEFNNASAIANRLGLDRHLVGQVIEFLLHNNLIIEKKKGFDIGPQVTHIGHDSPFVNRHHSNWRMQSLIEMDKSRKDDLFYTGPMALSKKAAEKIRESVIELIEKATKEASVSDSETLRCLSIDWFEVKK